jgi:peptidyl-prolyl cis-trans isomerase C
MVARFEDRTITQVYLSRLVKAAVTDDALHAKFEQLMKDYKGQDEVHARHILLDKEADAKAVIAQLDKGADFAKLADQKSKEKNNNGGDLGWFTHDKMVPEFADAAFALKKGEYTKTPVKTQFGWHVIKLEDRRTAAAPTFEEKKAELSQQIEGQVIDKTLADLKAKAKITEFNLDGSPLPAGATAPVPAAPAGPPGPAPAKP